MNSEEIFEFIQKKAGRDKVQIGDEMVQVAPTLEGTSLAEALEALVRSIEVELNYQLAEQHIARQSNAPVIPFPAGGPQGVVN